MLERAFKNKFDLAEQVYDVLHEMSVDQLIAMYKVAHPTHSVTKYTEEHVVVQVPASHA